MDSTEHTLTITVQGADGRVQARQTHRMTLRQAKKIARDIAVHQHRQAIISMNGRWVHRYTPGEPACQTSATTKD